MTRWDERFTDHELSVLFQSVNYARKEMFWSKENEEKIDDLFWELKKQLKGDLHKRDKQFVNAVIHRHSKNHGLSLEKVSQQHNQLFKEWQQDFDTLLEGYLLARGLTETFEQALVLNGQQIGEEAEQEAVKFTNRYQPDMITAFKQLKHPKSKEVDSEKEE